MLCDDRFDRRYFAGRTQAGSGCSILLVGIVLRGRHSSRCLFCSCGLRLCDSLVHARISFDNLGGT